MRQTDNLFGSIEPTLQEAPERKPGLVEGVSEALTVTIYVGTLILLACSPAIVIGVWRWAL